MCDPLSLVFFRELDLCESPCSLSSLDVVYGRFHLYLFHGSLLQVLFYPFSRTSRVGAFSLMSSLMSLARAFSFCVLQTSYLRALCFTSFVDVACASTVG